MIVGVISVGLGILGIFLPLLPTTCFLLLAATCFIRSSDRCYQWLINHRWFGSYIKTYLEQKRIPKKVKIGALIMLWTVIGISFVLINNIWVRIVLLMVVCGVSIHIASIKTIKE